MLTRVRPKQAGCYLMYLSEQKKKQLQVNSESIWKQDFRSVFDV